ncbi:MAG: hypothetical protein K2N58_03465 [Treponemataceae bacterium]|nr:hypothetical protein [Treponemataceae bacterium]
MEIKKYYEEIHKRFGNIRRARGNFLYTQKNVRITDLYREEGRAILGWGNGAYTIFKNTLNKGLAGSFITASRARLENAVSDILNSKRKIFVFSKKEIALQASLIFCKESVAFFKPFAKNAQGEPIDFSATKCVVLYPPLPWTKDIFIVAVLCDGSENSCGEYFEEQLKQTRIFGQPISPALEAAASRSFYDLISAQKNFCEKDFFIYDKILAKYWRREGCYLRPKISPEKYDDFVLHCLDCAIAISPECAVDSIVPFGADEGVFRKLEKSAFEF